jgi:hypothetical protein
MVRYLMALTVHKFHNITYNIVTYQINLILVQKEFPAFQQTANMDINFSFY